MQGYLLHPRSNGFVATTDRAETEISPHIHRAASVSTVMAPSSLRACERIWPGFVRLRDELDHDTRITITRSTDSDCIRIVEMETPDSGHWLFTIRSLPLMFDTLSHLGCIHQSMLIFHLQRAAQLLDPEISDDTLARLCDAIIQRCAIMPIEDTPDTDMAPVA